MTDNRGTARKHGLLVSAGVAFALACCTGCQQEMSPPPKADTPQLIPGATGGSQSQRSTTDTTKPSSLPPPK